MSFEVKNIVKKYGDKTVVQGLSFRMDEPGVYALLGTNGAGKTTSIRIMLGMLASDSGEVLWNGKPLDPINTNVGYLAEERGLYPKYSLMDQLLYFAALKNVPLKTAKERIKYWSKRLNLDEYLYPAATAKGKKGKVKKADQLSKGNQQKIQLMAALISDPQLIIFDEPLSGLDPVNTDLFKSIIKEEIEKNKYIIMSSHQMPTVEEFCEEITILSKGQVVLQGNLNEIKKSYGRVNLFVKVEGEMDDIIEQLEIKVIEKTPNGYQMRISKQEQADKLLSILIERHIPIVKFELREPSLHEIFVEKVQDTLEDSQTAQDEKTVQENAGGNE